MTTTIICGACEREWSGDRTSSRTCPACGNDGDIEPHTVRVDEPPAAAKGRIGGFPQSLPLEITASIELQREFNRLNSARIEEQYGSFGIYKVEEVADLRAQRERIAAILATFYRAELSISSVQPILDLAVELNPDLKKGKEPQDEDFKVGDSVNVLDAFRLPREVVVGTGTVDRISHQSDGTPLYWLSGRYTAVTSRQLRSVK